MWDIVAKLKRRSLPLAYAMLTWSGAFPFVKLVLLGAVDFLGWKRKEGVSRWWKLLLVLSKWSFINIWAIAFAMMVVHIDTTKRQTFHALWFSARFKLQLWVQAYARVGCFTFAAALVVTQFLGHFVIQRAVYRFVHPLLVRVPNGGKCVLFCDEMDLVALMQRSSGSCTLAITLGAFLSFFGIFAGIFLPMVHVEWHMHKHVVKSFVDEHVRTEDIQTYSLASALKALRHPCHHIDVGIGSDIESENVGIGANPNFGMAIMVFFFVVLAPLVRSLCTLLLWFLPMSKSGHRLFAGIVDVVGYIAAAECFGFTACLVIQQFPRMIEHTKPVEDGLVSLVLKPCIGLYILTSMGFLDTFTAFAVHSRYMSVVEKESQSYDIENREENVDLGKTEAGGGEKHADGNTHRTGEEQL